MAVLAQSSLRAPQAKRFNISTFLLQIFQYGDYIGFGIILQEDRAGAHKKPLGKLV